MKKIISLFVLFFLTTRVLGDGTFNNVGGGGGVPTSRLIDTTPPLTGGGDLSGDLTLGITKATSLVDGYLDKTDWSTFNAKVSTTRTINTTAPITGGGDLSADRTIAMPAATGAVSGYLTSTDWTTFNAKVPTTTAINTTAPLTGGGDLSSSRTLSIPQATGAVDGYLAASDFTTFNNKEPAITAGTTTQYWRGDKSFQTLNMAALLAVTSGAAQASGKIGEVLTASQATATNTGVGATGVFGNVTSLALTAGSWIVWGVVGFTENSATLTDFLQAGISASATGSGISEFDTQIFNGLISSTSDLILTTPPVLVNIASPTTYYLNTKINYSAGSPQHRGKITALRIF